MSEHTGPIEHFCFNHVTATKPRDRFSRHFRDRDDRVRIGRGVHQRGALVRKRLNSEAFSIAIKTCENEVAAARTTMEICVKLGGNSWHFRSAAAREAGKSWSHQFVEAHECGCGIARKDADRHAIPRSEADWPA